MQGLSIIIPTINEADNIEPLLKRIAASLDTMALQNSEVIFVDDGSTDATQDNIKAWQGKFPVRLISRPGKNGLASAVIEGARLAVYDYVLVMDADLSHPPEAIPELAGPVMSGCYDMIIGSRYIKGGGTPGWPLLRRLASRGATLLAWPFLEVKDPMAGFFCTQRRLLAEMPLDISGFKIGFEILMRHSGSLRVNEVPIVFHDREQGQSKLSGPVVKQYLRQLFSLTGGNFSVSSGSKSAFVGVLGVVIDLVVFSLLTRSGASLGYAHSLSFIAAALSNFLLNTYWSFSNPAKTVCCRKSFAFITVALLAFFMRGGILGSLVLNANTPPQLAILAAIGAAAVINFLGGIFWVFPEKSTVAPEHKWRILTLGVVAYAILLRLAYLGIVELMPEEAYYWNYAQHLDIGYLDHPPMVAWLIWVTTHIFGDNEFGVRSGAFFCWVISAIFLYRLARNLFDKGSAFRAVLFLAIMPYFFGIGMLMFPDSPLVLCWAGALFFAERALLAGKRSAWYGLGVILGLGMLSKYTIALLGPSIIIFMLVDRDSRKWLLKPEPYLAVIIVLLLFSPVVIWNATHDWASFVFQGPTRWQASFDFSLPSLIASIMILLTPTGLAAVIFLLFSGRQKMSENICTLLRQDRKSLFAWLFSVLPLSVFVFFSLSRETKMNWTGPLWLALLPFIAYQLKRNFPGRYQLAINRAWPGTILVFLLLYGAGLHYLTLGFPGAQYPNNFSWVGWADLSQQIAAVEDEIILAKQEKAVVVGMDKYNLASFLAFYRTRNGSASEKKGHEKIALTSSVNVFDRNGLMYGFWADKGELVGRTMILVARERPLLEAPDKLVHFKTLGPIVELPIKKNGVPFGKYFYRIAEGYDSAG